jgi:COX assembly mitochondrial protein 1
MDMAPNTLSPGTLHGPDSVSHQPNLHNPLPLSASQEAQVKDIYYRRVRGHCAQEIKGEQKLSGSIQDLVDTINCSLCSLLKLYSDFAECALGRTISATWICRNQRLTMNSCMITHATRAEEDAARAEWFSGREDRRRKREDDAAAVERRREEVIALIKREEEKEKLAKEKALDARLSAESSKGWWGR